MENRNCGNCAYACHAPGRIEEVYCARHGNFTGDTGHCAGWVLGGRTTAGKAEEDE